jgi:hypothetical protein
MSDHINLHTDAHLTNEQKTNLDRTGRLTDQELIVFTDETGWYLNLIACRWQDQHEGEITIYIPKDRTQPVTVTDGSYRRANWFERQARRAADAGDQTRLADLADIAAARKETALAKMRDAARQADEAEKTLETIRLEILRVLTTVYSPKP